MSTSLSPLLAPMLSSAAMRAVCDDAAVLQRMLDFEAALARAEAVTGVIPANAAGPITKACKAEAFDRDALAEAATRSGNAARSVRLDRSAGRTCALVLKLPASACRRSVRRATNTS